MKQLITTYLALTCIALMFGSNLSAQNRVKILTPNYFDEINGSGTDALPIPSTAVPLPGFDPTHGYNGFKAKGSQNIQVDAEGKIMFFIVDGYIFDRKGNLFGQVASNATPLGLGDGGFCETAIIPSPECGTPNTFFILTTYKLSNGPDGYSACWDKIVISYDYDDEPTPDSYVLSKKINVGPSSMVLDDLLLDKMIPSFLGGAFYHCNAPYIAASKVLSGDKRYVYVLNVATIYRFKIQNDLFVYDNYSLPLMPTFFHAFDRCQLYDRSEMELISMPNNDLRLAFPMKAAVTNQDALRPGFATLDFDSSTGNVDPASLKTIFYPILRSSNENSLEIKGAELSPDGSKLYLSHNLQIAYPSTLDMFDLTASDPQASISVISIMSDFGDSQIESGMGGVLLIPSNNQLYKITDPNTLTPTLAAYQGLTGYTPNCPLSYCNPDELVRYMQDQIDGEDYSAYGSINYSDYTYTVSGSETWSPGNNPFNNSARIYIKESIVIPFFSTLTINDLIIEFAPNARVIVESGFSSPYILFPGGRLNLNNTTLTSDDDRCSDNMWRGIEVRGSSTKSQGTVANSLQGKVIMHNSTIKNAIKGIVASSYIKTTNGNNVTFTAENARGGGIIQASNSFFFNNQNDISLLNYNTQTSDNLSIFTNCVFETSSLLNIPHLNVDNHMFLNNVKGIYILGCDFINSVPELFMPHTRGTGLAAVSSSFTVEPKCMNMTYPCNQFDQGQFIGLRYGISSLSLSATQPYTCDRAIFKNNAIGIYDALSINSRILRNSFEVSEISPSTPIVNQSSGIYLVQSTGYRVEENTFKEFDDAAVPNGTARSYGVVVSNSGIASNLIYKNTFSNLKIGGQSEGINGRTINSPSDPVDSEGKMSGLQWKCNTFNSLIYSNDLTVIDGKIDYNQGYTDPTSIDAARKKAANNKFSLHGEGMGLQHDLSLSTSSQHINYVYTTGNNYVPDSYTATRMAIQSSQHNGSSIPYSDLGCPSKIRGAVVVMSRPFKINTLKDVKDPYKLRMFSEENSELITYLLTDTTLKNGYLILNELLSENDDKEYQILKAENQLFNLNHSLDEVLVANPNLSFDQKTLLSIKNTLSSEGIDILKDESLSGEILSSLNKIINSTNDVLIRKQAEIIYSFSKPEGLTYYFLEDFSSKSMKLEDDENQLELNEDRITVYPNPASGELTFAIKFDLEKNLEAKVFSTLGNQVASWTLSKNYTTVDVSKLINGIYFIQLKDVSGMNVQNIKFVKK